MLRLILLLTAMALSASCTEGRSPVGTDRSASTDAGPTAVTIAEQPGAAAGRTEAGQKAYIDPDSGDLVSQLTNGTEAAPEDPAIPQASLSVSEEAMKEEPSPVFGGGVMIDLNGRFQNPVSATIAEDGSATVDHPAEERKASTHAAP